MGTPTLELGVLRVWVQGRQFPWAEDFWDGNWLVIAACCTSLDSVVWARGPLLHLGDILRWAEATERILLEREGSATLWGMEPELHLRFTPGEPDQARAEIRISPNLAYQEHAFRCIVPWWDVQRFHLGLRSILDAYPLREPQGLGKVAPKPHR